MSPQVLRRRDPTVGSGLRAVLSAQEKGASAFPIPSPPKDTIVVKAAWDSFLLESFTAGDAWELGHLLYARLLPFSTQKPTLISIALANGQVLFQSAVGSGTTLDNETWVQRKRNTVLRFGTSTWFQHCKYAGDEEAFRLMFAMSPEQAEKYAIHGGGVPIRVQGVEGIVAIVVVSGLKPHEDHGVIVDVINNNWE
ncbi:hypothetical protein F4813DRAFT_348278 [Daldinia decipiens]|uniref:uncharacterized protein n=1 Tax=Daldinia decipiens TaxID=326647 RepID=UPI0020C44DBD|nr:uncharacterized protein F4813DRAFT_348278 [Daldinia decipiens]KAI1660770.1 hypothetical protein F4813DRAFT_348278 [Daldinia decipiens]